MPARAERGSVLMLFPAGILVMLLLGTIAVDHSAVFLAQRQLENQCAALANDISTRALDDQWLYADAPAILLDPAVARRIVSDAEAAINAGRPLGAVHDVALHVRIDGDRVTVRATGKATGVFHRPVFGSASLKVSATSTAQAVLGE